ncbi:anhydro-N-acetylmuramic acid kinase [Micromonospora sp. M12]
MSGTSYDGIEAAAAEFDLSGDTVRMRPLGRLSHPYPDQLRTRIAAALPPAPTTTEAICVLDTGIGQAFAEAGVRALAELCGARPTWSSRTARPCTTGSRPAWSGALSNWVSRPGSRRPPAFRSWPTCAAATSPPAARARRWSPCSTGCCSTACPVSPPR